MLTYADVCSEHTYVGHTDCVRALAMMPGIGFVSTGDVCLRMLTYSDVS
jgi:hypothetical protein